MKGDRCERGVWDGFGGGFRLGVGGSVGEGKEVVQEERGRMEWLCDFEFEVPSENVV